ncbi:MAG: ADP-ribosylation factor-like protein [Promethearchaeota archaeon]
MFIYRGNELLYYRHFGKALKQEALNLLVEDIIDEALISRESKLGFHDYYKYRVSFITEKETNLIFLFVSSLTDKFENIKKELVKCKTEFLNLFADILQHRFDAKTFEVFDPIIDSIHRNLRPKISLVGFSGVGKTTITRLIKADEIPMQHIPTITGDIATIRIGKLHFHLWDFAGQEQFSYLWNNFIKGSDAILLITDSTLENVEKSKYFLELIKEQAPYAQSAVIGNKQDLKSAMNPVQIENLLGLKAYSMIALDPKNRDKMIQIIADILEMSAEVSPLLKPLLERDKLTEEAVKALKNADFNKAAFLFDKISDLCIELGDDSLGREFFEKSQKIKDMLKKVGAPPPTPAVPIIPEEQQAPVFHKKAEELEKSISLPKSTITPQSPPSIHQELKTEQKAVETPILNKSPHIPKSDINSLQPEISVKDTKEIVKPKETGVIKENVGLKLNPEDFMVKIKPKSVEFVPKDAKSKLKISPFSQVKNTDEFKAPVPVSPIRLMEQKVKTSIPESKKLKIPKTTVNSVDKITSEVISKVKQEPIIMDTQQKDDLKKSLLELKIKKANLTKMSLDFEMKELTGEITKDELKEKKEKVSEYVKKIEQQIQKLQKLLND